MNRIKILIAVITLITFISNNLTFAQTPSPAQLYKQLISKYGKINSVSMDFDNMGQSGSIKAKTGNKYVLSVGQRQIICNGKSVWMCNEQNVVITNFRDNSSNLTLDKVFFDILPNLEPISVKALSGNNKQYLLELQNKDKDAEINNINLYLNNKLDKIINVEAIGKNISQKWNISNLVINKSLPDKIFEYIPAKGLEIIDMRE